MLQPLRDANLEPPKLDDRRPSFLVTFRNHTPTNPLEGYPESYPESFWIGIWIAASPCSEILCTKIDPDFLSRICEDLSRTFSGQDFWKPLAP
jgi:hypothetical protein